MSIKYEFVKKAVLKVPLPVWGLLVTLVALWAVVAIPKWQADRVALKDPEKHFEAENKARATLFQGLQALGGTFFFVTAYIAYKNLQIAEKTRAAAEDKQVSERFAKAVEMLADKDDKLDIRLGGVYLLERIATDSEEDRWTIAELLAAYVRRRAAKKDPPEDRDYLPEDIQAALNVIGQWQAPESKRINLKRTDLRNVNLVNAKLARVDLECSDLRNADLNHAILAGAELSGIDLSGAKLCEADFSGAIIFKAKFVGVYFNKTVLNQVQLTGCDLRKTVFDETDLDQIILSGTDLAEADLWYVGKVVASDIKMAKNWEKAFYAPELAEELSFSPEQRDRMAEARLMFHCAKAEPHLRAYYRLMGN